MKQNHISDLYGVFLCECGDGGYELLHSMCTEITSVYDSMGIEIDFAPIQTKEKYGELRVYYNASREIEHKICEIINKYEEKSETVCEECRSPVYCVAI